MSDRNDLPSISANNFDQRVRETLQTYLGRQGDPLDRGLTLRDLIENGIVKLPAGWTLRNGAGSVPLLPGDNSTAPSTEDEPDLTPPPTPTGFTVTAGLSFFLVEHDNPVYTQGRGHLRTRLYGATWTTTLPTFADAVEIAQFTGRVYAHPTSLGTKWRLWIKWESNDNVLSVSPAGGTNGLAANTGLVGTSDLTDALITAGKIASGAIDLGGDKILGLLKNANMEVISDPTKIADSLIGNTKLANLAITAGKIANGAIDLGGAKVSGLLANANLAVIADPTKIADFLISSTKLADLAVTAGKIASGAITLTKFASGIEPVSIATGSLPTTKSTEALVFGGKLYRWSGTAYTVAVDAADLSGQVQNAQIAALAASKITGQLTNAQIADLAAAKLTGQITNTQISDDAITTPKLAAGAVVSAKIAANTIVAGNIAAGTITGTEIAAATITGAKIAAGTIQAGNIAAGTITGDRIAGNTITGSNIAADTITAAQIAAGAISVSELATGAVTAGKIAAGAIIANDGVITNGAITNALIANAAVGSAQIADAAITSAKIANLAVGTAAIQTGAITTALIANAAVGSAQIVDAAITSAKIGLASVGAAAIQDLAVTNAKIANLAIDDAKVAGLSAAKITAGTIAADRLDASIITSKVLTVDWAKITNASVTSAQIANAAITSAKIASTIQSDNYAAGSAGWQINRAGTAEFNNITLRGKITAGPPPAANQVEVGANVASAGHHGITLSAENYNNCFIRREGDGAVFFNLNSGGTNAMSFNSVSGVLQVRGDIEATSLKVNTAMVSTLNINGSAVTVPVFGSSFVDTYTFGTGWTPVLTLSVPVSGLQSGEFVGLIVNSVSSIYPADNVATDVTLGIFINGTLITELAASIDYYGFSHAGAAFALVPNGTNTVQFRYRTGTSKTMTLITYATALAGKR